MKEFIDDKIGRLDIRAETLDGVQIDIEMQLANEHNMDRRILFYFGKLFLESIKMEENLSVEQLKELINMDPIIKKTEERLEWLSSDEETRRRYEMREVSRIRLNSILHEAEIAEAKGKIEGEREGILKGRSDEKIAIAKEMLLIGMNPDAVSSITKLSLGEVRHLADELNI